MNGGDDRSGSPFFGALPKRGVWTAVGLTRGQFLVTLGASVVAFLFVDGPLWRYVDANHFRRIVLSYLLIPGLIAGFQLRDRGLDVSTLLGGTIVIGVIKLLLTALIVLMMSF